MGETTKNLLQKYKVFLAFKPLASGSTSLINVHKMYETLSCFNVSWNLQNICKFTFRFHFRQQLGRKPTHQDINQQT